MDTDEFSEMAYNIIVRAARTSYTRAVFVAVCYQPHQCEHHLVNFFFVVIHCSSLRMQYMELYFMAGINAWNYASPEKHA
jgi:hypothetical protein